MELHHLVGVFDKLVGQLRDVDESILMDPDIDEGPKVGDVGHDARQFHSLAQVVDGVDAVGEAKLLDGLARVAPRLLQFGEDVVERGQSDGGRDVAPDVDLPLLLLVGHELRHGATLVGRHALHDGVALGVDCRVVERILRSGDA